MDQEISRFVFAIVNGVLGTIESIIRSARIGTSSID